LKVAERSSEKFCLWLATAVFLFPLVWMVGYAAVCSLGGVGSVSEGWTLKHWQLALGSSRIWQSLAFSTAMSFTATALAWLLAIGLVDGVRSLREDVRFQSILYLLLALPPLAAGFTARLWLSRGGLISRLAVQLGICSDIQDFPVLVQDRLSISLLLTLTLSSLPLLILYLQRIWKLARLDDYFIIACCLGASPRYASRYIVIPMLWRRSQPVLLMVFLWNFGAWEVPLLLGRKSPPMLSVLIQQSSGQFVLDERPQAFAFALVYLCLSAAAVWFLSGWQGFRSVGRASESSSHG
jgi:putative spermidine/putrescine transport system permease protein